MVKGETGRRVALGVSLVLCFSLLFPFCSAEEANQIKSDAITDDVVSSVGQTGISPLSTTTPTYWSATDITNMLNRVDVIRANAVAMAGYLLDIKGNTSSIITISNNVATLVNRLTVVGGTLHTWLNTGFEFLGGKLDNTNSVLSELQVALEGNNLGFPDGKSLYDGGYFFGGQSRTFAHVMNAVLNIDGYSLPRIVGNVSALKLGFDDYLTKFDSYSSAFGFTADNSAAAAFGFTESHPLSDVLEYAFWDENYNNPHGGDALDFIGMSTSVWSDVFHILGYVGSNSTVSAGSLPDVLDSQDDLIDTWSGYKEDNLLSRLSVLFPMQNDLARLTFVLADPTTIELKKSQEDNEQAVVDNFTGDKGVQADNIGDMSGVGDSLGSLTNTGVSVGDGFAQINKSWGFFSQETASQLDTVPMTVDDEDEDFIHFYDPENTAFKELLQQVRGEGG